MKANDNKHIKSLCIHGCEVNLGNRYKSSHCGNKQAINSLLDLLQCAPPPLGKAQIVGAEGHTSGLKAR